jgi:hypothetical protein
MAKWAMNTIYYGMSRGIHVGDFGIFCRTITYRVMDIDDQIFVLRTNVNYLQAGAVH